MHENSEANQAVPNCLTTPVEYLQSFFFFCGEIVLVPTINEQNMQRFCSILKAAPEMIFDPRHGTRRGGYATKTSTWPGKAHQN